MVTRPADWVPICDLADVYQPNDVIVKDDQILVIVRIEPSSFGSRFQNKDSFIGKLFVLNEKGRLIPLDFSTYSLSLWTKHWKRINER